MKHFTDDELYYGLTAGTPEPGDGSDDPDYEKRMRENFNDICKNMRAPKQETEPYVVLYFASKKDKLAFLASVGVEAQHEHFINGYDFAEKIGKAVDRTAEIRVHRKLKKEDSK